MGIVFNAIYTNVHMWPTTRYIIGLSCLVVNSVSTHSIYDSGKREREIIFNI